MAQGPSNARTKAAAWAWYQRGSASAFRAEAPGSAPSSLPHRSGSSSSSGPSRFKLEADLILVTCGKRPVDDACNRFDRLRLSPPLSNSSSAAVVSSDDMLALSPAQWRNPADSPPLAGVVTNLALATGAGSGYGTPSWDCGSSLFDSFELVAMSKTLDDAHQLSPGAIEKVSPRAVEAMASGGTSWEASDEAKGAQGDKDEEEETSTGSAMPPQRQPPTGTDNLLGLSASDSTRLDADVSTHATQHDNKESRRAIYDMLCHYNSLTLPAGSTATKDEDQIKKHSNPVMLPSSPARSNKQYRRRRLHSVSKAFRAHFVQLSGQSLKPLSTLPSQLLPDGSCLQQPASCVHEHHCKATCRVQLPASEDCRVQASNRSLIKKQHSSDNVHHHHHHHYHHHHHHYLLGHHPDEGFGVLPIIPGFLGADKSLLVAAAGLGASKASSLQNYISLSTKPEGALADSKHSRGGGY